MSIRPILINGPTASGKSGLALALAERLGGLIVNADALQVYAEWRVLTARPSAEDEARAPHRLYGHVPAADAGYSAGRWLREAAPLIEAARAEGRRPIVVGGTGLYFKALTEGLAEAPPTTPEIRAEAEAMLERLGAEGFADALAARDPQTAARIDRLNPRRVMRAWEVLLATGRGLADWMDATPPPALPLSDAIAIRLEPPREELRGRIARRFGAMLEEGALDECRAMRALVASGAVPPKAPALKALGFARLDAYLDGALSRDDAVAAAITDTQRYAKRQSTWLRNQMSAWASIEAPSTINIDAIIAEATT